VVGDRTAAADSMAEAAAFAAVAPFAAAGVSAAAALEAHGLMAEASIAGGSEEGGLTAEAHTEAVHSEAPGVLRRADLDAEALPIEASSVVDSAEDAGVGVVGDLDGVGELDGVGLTGDLGGDGIRIGITRRGGIPTRITATRQAAAIISTILHTPRPTRTTLITGITPTVLLMRRRRIQVTTTATHRRQFRVRRTSIRPIPGQRLVTLPSPCPRSYSI
jgi:hypothetical protein